MNFDDIKKEMDRDVMEDKSLTDKINLGKGMSNLVAKIRRNVQFEIFAQLGTIAILMCLPILKPMEDLPRGLYLILAFIVGIMILVYTFKLKNLLTETEVLASSTRHALQQFIFETKLILGVYKSFVIAASLILPIPIFLIFTGSKEDGNMALFYKWISLDLSSTELLLLVIAYLVIAVLIYGATIAHIRILYGKYLSQLEGLLNELNE